MLLEIMTPYDNEGANDVFTNHSEMFARLAEMTIGDEGFAQTEISIIRWASQKEREEHRHDPDFEYVVVLEIDDLA